MTLTQLNAFVLVARLGSVRAAAGALGVSESAVSQAITALRQDLGDQLITRSQAGMTLTPGGTRLLGIASQIVVLGAEAHAAVRAAQGAPEQLRIVATSTFAEFVAGPLMEAFRRRFAGAVEITTGVAASGELGVLIANRLADVAFGAGRDRRARAADRQRAHLQVPAGRGRPGREHGPPRPRGPARQWRWLVDPSGTDPGSETARLLRRLGIADSNIGVFQSQTAAWAAAADGAGVAPAIEHLVSQQLRRGELSLVDTAGFPGRGVLARDPARTGAAQHRGERAAEVPRHPGGDAPDPIARRRRAAVPLQAPGLRHDLELNRPICLPCSPDELVD